MKKIYIFTAVLALLTLSLNAQLQAKKKAVVKQQATADKVDTRPDGKGPNRANRDMSVTVGDNSSYTGYVPVYGTWFDSDAGQRNQMIYSSDLLGLPVGAQITSLKFYARGTLGFHSAPVRLSIGHTTASSFTSSSFVSSSDLNQVATVTPTTSMTELNFTFSQAFTYNGGNLLIQIDSDKGEYGSTDFYANEQSDYVGIIAYQGYSDNGLTIHDRTRYLPMATFTYTATDPLITASSSNLTFNTMPGVPASQTLTIAGYNLTYDITATVSGDSEFSVNPTTLGTDGGNLTINYSPTATGSHSATLILSSTGAEDVNITLNGTCSYDLTICDGTGTNTYLPIYGYYYDNYQKNQMIYPESMVGALSGRVITSMTFYANGNFNFNGGQLTVSLGTTDQTSYSGKVRLQPADMAIVKSGFDVPSSGNTWTIEFDTPFEYNGGNLVVDFEETSHSSGSGHYSSQSFGFYGITQTGGGFYSNGSTYNADFSTVYSGGSVQNFLPKVTIASESNEPRHDLSIALSAPASVVGGNTATVTATVTNTGNQTETGYTVTITDGTNNLLNQTATEPLAPGATATFTAEYNTTEAQVGNTVNFTANVTCADDADASNNSATASMQIITMPAPENVAATTSGNNATMTWSAPIIPSTATPVTETFENTASNVLPTGWTIVDNDVDGYNWYHHININDGNNISAHGGVGAMASESYNNDTETALTPNNWLITPLAVLDGTFSFWAVGQDAKYSSEVFGVYVTTSNDPTNLDNYVQVAGDFTATSTYTQYTANLSSYAGQLGYIAIVHHNVSDMFILAVDDVTYQVSTPGEQPTSYNIYLDGQFMGNVDANTFSYDFSNVAAGNHECSVSAVYPGGIESAQVPANFTILPTPNAPAVSSNNGTTSTTITITPDANTDGQLVYYVDYNGQQTQDLTFPRGETDYVVTVHAYTTATENYNQSPEAVIPVTIPALPQTPAPTIAISSQTDDEVTITATGNGTVILNIPGYPQATGNGSASITVPRHMSDYVVTATATAQASGELVSTTTTQNITVPGMGNDGWTQMTETYNNPNDLLSFKVKVGNDTTSIMMIDQFLASTVYNDHPSSYTYVLKENKVINGVDSTMTSNPATVPVYKTNSTMRSLYTEAQVLADDYADEANRLTANAVNGEMDYNVVPDNNVLYYSLYRGGIQEETPEVDVDHRISQLQKFDDKVGDNVIYYFTENHPTGILPRYDHEDNIGSQIVERLDVDYVTGETGNQMSYVPVIWTFGLYTARGDGKNNSYGSDIKYNELGGVDVSSEIIVNWSNNNKMKVNGVDYYVVSPVITLDAVAPELVKANDEDAYQYVPYMYRVWCTYTDAHNFGHLLNPDGINYSLVETGLIDAPFCIGEVKADTLSNPSHVVIGRDLGHVSPQTQWSFAVTKEAVTNGDIEFVVRYYYKKVVTDADPTAQPSGLRGNRDSGADYAIYEKTTSSSDIVTGVNELWSDYGKVVISQTYVNAQGMQSDKPFDGLNIVVTRFSDGTTTTTKVVR